MFLDSLDMKNLSNMASELLEFEDDDDAPTPPSANGGMTPVGDSHQGYSHRGHKRSSPDASINSLERKEMLGTGPSKFKTHNMSNLSTA